MKVLLVYRGPLPTTQRGNAAERHAIRMVFSSQLEKFWQIEPTLKNRLSDSRRCVHAEIKDRKITWASPQRDTAAHACFWSWGYKIVPLVSTHSGARVTLRITIDTPLRPGEPKYPDVDNQVKTLFDALRMPQADQEMPSAPSGPWKGHQPMFCLVQDDSLIDQHQVSRGWLTTNVSPDHVDVRIEATTVIATQHPDNAHLG